MILHLQKHFIVVFLRDALECLWQFLCEKRIKMYNWYIAGVSQQKIDIDAKTFSKPGGFADWLAGRVHLSE